VSELVRRELRGGMGEAGVLCEGENDGNDGVLAEVGEEGVETDECGVFWGSDFVEGVSWVDDVALFSWLGVSKCIEVRGLMGLGK